MNTTKLREIYKNAKEANLSDIAAESLAFFANANEKYFAQGLEEEISSEGYNEFESYFKDTFLPAVNELRTTNMENSLESINEQVKEVFENVKAASLELAASEDVFAINTASVDTKYGIHINACEFIAADEETYNDYVSKITSAIGNTGDFIPTVETTGIDTYIVRYLYPYGGFKEEINGIESIEEFLDINAYTNSITSVNDVQDVTIKDVDGMNVQPMMECTAEEILDYVSNTTSKSLYGQMKDIYDKYGEESVQFEQATNLYKKIAKIGVESVVTSMCVCSALGIPYKSSKIVYNEMFDD
jgi:hypothetical protein